MNEPVLYTIGYGARTREEFLAVLQSYRIRYLIDVRSRPYSSYKPEFSQNALQRFLEANGIRYLFMGDTLGGQPEDESCYVDGKVDYTAVAEKPFYRRGIERLRSASSQPERVVLMCSEGKPENCHRSKLIGRTLAAEGVAVVHIDEHDKPLSQEEVILRLTKGQPSLFGDDFSRFTSRKRYRQEEE
ncbi:MAG: DUF488 domain-containing protein [Deltaproteobacteria bacterium]|nr:MAG: DUF488 domain-containing protein [Deltaproteobacteria bacterium]